MLFKKYSNLLKTIYFFLFLFVPFGIVYAQSYIPLAQLPGVTQTGTNLGEYLAAIFNIGIGLAVVLSILMIVIAGIQLIGGAASPSAQKSAREKIQNVLFGLLLAVGSWLVVYTINPQLILGTFELTPVTSVPTVVLTSLPPSVSNISSSSLTPTTPTNSITPPSISTQLIEPVVEIQPTTVSYPSYYATPEVVTASDIDTTNDYSMMQDCISNYVSGICDSADLDSNGIIDSADLSLLNNTWKYNANGDDVIDLSVNDLPITSCFFKIKVAVSCLDETGDWEGDSDGRDDRWNNPTCYSANWYMRSADELETKCASDSYGDLVLINENLVRRGVTMFTGVPSKSLSSLSSYLFDNCNDDENLPCYRFGYGAARSKIIYYTFANFDTDNNSWADFAGQDPLADFNGDGVVDDTDSRFVELMRNGVGTPDNSFVGDSIEFKNIGIPPTFSINALESLIFDSSSFTDREVVEYCINKPSIMGCATADIDGSCSSSNDFLSCPITQDDLNKFDVDIPKFDINGDGVVNFKNPS